MKGYKYKMNTVVLNLYGPQKIMNAPEKLQLCSGFKPKRHTEMVTDQNPTF